MTPQQKLDQLIARFDQLRLQHQDMSTQLIKLRDEIKSLRAAIHEDSPPLPKHTSIDEVPQAEIKEEQLPEVDIDFSKGEKVPGPKPPPLPASNQSDTNVPNTKPQRAFDLETFIGGNLINKIGILILIVGLGLFVKYAIDNGYLSPIVRLIMSFLAGLSLVGIGYRLKSKYKTYSAVLFSGGMVVLYFSAFAGNVYFDPVLLPKSTAFILMVVFTIVTVSAAMMYDLQIIALLGLVGAYGVPVLLSDGSGDYPTLFAYMAIINTGIMLISIRKRWQITLIVAFALTWLLMAYWILIELDSTNHLRTAWIFNSLFFILFYIASLLYDLLQKKQLSVTAAVLVPINGFIFYGLGLWLLEEYASEDWFGYFAFINALVHLGVAAIIYRWTTDKRFFHLLAGLFWVFLTIGIGVQFGGSVRLLLWLAEAVLLFGISRRFSIKGYQAASFVVLFIGLVFLLENWISGYYQGLVHLDVLLNKYFLSSVFTVLALSVLLWINDSWKNENYDSSAVHWLITSLLIGVIYLSFFHEIHHQYEQAFINSQSGTASQTALLNFRVVWLINYSLIFMTCLLLVNQYILRHPVFANVLFFITGFLLVLSLTGGMYALNELREEYLNPDRSPSYTETSYWLWIRYVTYGLIAILLWQSYKAIKWIDQLQNVKAIFQLLVYTVILVVLSNELTTFMRLIVGVETNSLTHRVGFSILWAIYALLMIIIGFRQDSKMLRVAGITLLGVTLIKIFLLDLENISRESRIVLFVAIGILLLIASYFYNRNERAKMRRDHDSHQE